MFPQKIKPIFPVNNKVINRFRLSSHQSKREKNREEET